MNEQDAGRLLMTVKTLDQRMPEPDEQGFVRRLWAGLLADVPLDAALQAVQTWYRSERYRETRDPISPADIVGWWRDRRRHPPVERGGEVVPERIRAGVDRCVAALAAGRGMELEAAECEADARRLVLSVRCEWCGAEVGRPCTTPKGLPLTKVPGAVHPKRRAAAVDHGTVPLAHDVASAHGTM